MVAAALIVNVSYGCIFYSFSVLLGEAAAAAEFSRTTLSAALGLGLIVSGLLAPPVGALCDASGPKRIFLAGAFLGGLGLALFSMAQASWQVIVIWAALLGPAMACAFYEPAYVAVDQWFDEARGKAIGILTLVAGLSSVVFIPLTQYLVGGFGWRATVLLLAGLMLFGVAFLALFFVRDRPRGGADLEGTNPRAVYRAMVEGARRADRVFWLISAAFFLGLAGTFGMLFHQLAYLQSLGFSASRVAAVVGVAGLAGLPARFLLPALADRVRPAFVAAIVFGLLGTAGFVLLGASGWWRVYVYAGIFGAAFGSALPMRALMMAGRFSGEAYGRLMGLQQTMMALAMAGGPFLVGAASEVSGGYSAAWLGAAVVVLLAVPLVFAAGARIPAPGDTYGKENQA
ncbi:MAG: MFS transporter [Rubrobacteraceae bacterium]